MRYHVQILTLGLAILTGVFHGIPQFLQANARKIPSIRP
jgi:hypothetical protein